MAPAIENEGGGKSHLSGPALKKTMDGIFQHPVNGARGRARTGMVLPPRDFKSLASTNFATRASCQLYRGEGTQATTPRRAGGTSKWGYGGWARSRTEVHGFAGRCITTLPPSRWVRNLPAARRAAKQKTPALPPRSLFISGAGNETRTRDPNLGKVVLYQLSYSRLAGELLILAPRCFVSRGGPNPPPGRRCGTIAK